MKKYMINTESVDKHLFENSLTTLNVTKEKNSNDNVYKLGIDKTGIISIKFPY